MEELNDAIDIIGQISLVVFAISTFIIVRTVRRGDFDTVNSIVTNPVIPNFDLAFYPWLLKTYSQIKQSKVLVYINLISLIGCLLSVIFIFISALLGY